MVLGNTLDGPGGPVLDNTTPSVSLAGTLSVVLVYICFKISVMW